MPAAIEDLPRVGTVLELAAGHEAFEWFGRGPHETYPDRRRGGRVGLWRSTVADQLCPTSDRRRTAATATPAGSGSARPAGGSASTSTRPARSRPRTSTAADLDAATHDVELRPAPGDDRPPRRRPPRARHRQLRPGHARTVRPSRRHLPLGVDAVRPSPARDDPLGRDRPRMAPRERPRQLRDAGARERLARAPPRRRADPIRRLPAAPRPADFPGYSNRVGEPVGSRSPCRASATSGSRRWSSRARTARPCSTSGTPHTGSARASRTCRISRRPTPSRTTRRETLEVDLVDAPTGLSVTVRTTLFADRPVVARSLTLVNGGAAPLVIRCAMSAVLDLPDADWNLVTLRHVGPRAARV